MRFKKIWKVVCALVILVAVVAPVIPANADTGTGQTACPLFETGVMAGYGVGNIPEGKYRPLLMVWHIGFKLKQFSSREPETKRDTLFLFLEPQVNPSFSPATNVEFGIGCGLKYRHHITERVSAYCMVSVGPQWMSLQTKKQADGFLFSDMAGVGLSVLITERSAIDLEFRGRHLSNAGLKLPNGGINSCVGVVGYSVFF